jgi:hypothetical protein
LRSRSKAPAAMLPSPKMAGTMVPLPVNGRLPVAVALGPIVVVVPGPPCAPMVAVTGEMVVLVGAVEPRSPTVFEVVLVATAVEVGPVVVLVVVDVDEVVEDVELDDDVVVGSQLPTSGSVADVVESTVRSGLRMVKVTVPCDGAEPVSCHICVGPELPVVS